MMIGLSEVSRPTDANNPTPSGRSYDFGAAMMSTQVGPLVPITQPCVAEQSGVQPMVVRRHCCDIDSHTELVSHRPLQVMAIESTLCTVKSEAWLGVGELAMA